MRGGRLGVGIQGLEPQLAEYFGLGDRTGVLITTVKDDSPAAKAGLKAGDVIIAVDGDEVEGVGDVSRLLWGADAGPAEIRILRDRKERTVTVELPENESTWHSGDGELNGFFFGPGESDADDMHMEWVEPLKEISRLRILTEPERSIRWVPRESVAQPARRSLSI
jgi:membrane-associated protease RseP (regulator of RpoE activity)